MALSGPSSSRSRRPLRPLPAVAPQSVADIRLFLNDSLSTTPGGTQPFCSTVAAASHIRKHLIVL